MKKIARGVLAGLGLVALGACAHADSIQPIVNPKQVLYGSAQKTITSNSDVTIDTTTHQLSAQQNILTNEIKFNDGTVITSSSTLGGTTAWGAITGTLRNQTDLQNQLTAIGVSTAALSTSTSTLGSSVAGLQAQVVSIGTSTGSLQTQINTLSVSTAAIQTDVTKLDANVAALNVSTAAIQAQLNAVVPVSLSTGVTGTLSSAHLPVTIAYTNIGNTFTSTNTFMAGGGNTFTYGVTAGSVTVGNLTPSQFVITDGSKHLSSVDLYGQNNFWNGQQTYQGSAGIYVTYGVNAGSITLTGLPGTGPLRGGTSVAVSTGPTNLATEVTGVLPVTSGGTGTATPSLIAGTNVTLGGTWPNQTINAAGGGAGNLGTYSNGVSVSSPTSALNTNASLKVELQGTSTAQFEADPSSVTLQGNTFNGASQLVQLSAGSQLPAVNGNLLTSLNAAALSGTVPAGVLQNAIINQSTLQTGATFYTSSGTVTNLQTGILKFSDGTTQTSAALNPTNVIINQNTLQSGATFYVSSGTVAGTFHASQIKLDTSGAGSISFPNLDHTASTVLQNSASSGQGNLSIGNPVGIDITPVQGQDLTAPFIVASTSVSIGGIINPTYNASLTVIKHNGYEISAATNTTATPDFRLSGGSMILGVNHGGGAVSSIILSNTDSAAPNPHDITLTMDGAFSPVLQVQSAIGLALNNGSGTAENLFAGGGVVGPNLGNYEANTFPGFDSNITFVSEKGVQIGTNTTSGSNSEALIMAPTTETYEIAAGTASPTSAFNFTVSTSGVVSSIGGIQGVTTNSSAASGIVGEQIQSQIAAGSAVPLVSGTAISIATITLTAGDWDVSGVVGYIPGGTVSYFIQSSGTTSNSNNNDQSETATAFASATTPSVSGERFPISTARYSVSSTTPVYLNAQAVFGTSMTAFGTIRARRIR